MSVGRRAAVIVRGSMMLGTASTCDDDAAGAAASGGPPSDQAAAGTGDAAPATETAALNSFSTTTPASGAVPISRENTVWRLAVSTHLLPHDRNSAVGRYRHDNQRTIISAPLSCSGFDYLASPSQVKKLP